MTSRKHQGPRAVLDTLERLANAYGSESVRVRQDLSIAESQLRDYQARLGKPWLGSFSYIEREDTTEFARGQVIEWINKHFFL
ncbi:MAG TPA: hypothetical protein VND64_35475 [Pirellulales bacterium]|nr:hypothetical protein [Pirellulales bacterium]